MGDYGLELSMRPVDCGPAAMRRPASAQDLEFCLALLRDGSKSFYAASLLLPKRLRADVYALYAFCRVADDLVDRAANAAPAVAAVRERLHALYSGATACGPVERAFADLLTRHPLPIEAPAALVEGFAWDAERRVYETISDLRAYGMRVAGAVGVMMTLLMGVRSAEALARASDLGVAMQLTNIARDVGDDARAGRLYLPREWLRAEGVDAEAWLANPVPCPQIARVTQRLLEEADRLYRRAEQGIALLPADVRPAIWAARRIYAEIGAQTRRNGLDSVTRRAVVSKRRKLALVAAAMVSSLIARKGAPHPPLAEAADLVRIASDGAREPLDRSFSARLIRAVELFQRLREAEQGGYAPSPDKAA